MELPTRIYQQFDADYTRAVPASAFGGWRWTTVRIAPRNTAVVVVHAADFGPRAAFPGLHACCDELQRAEPIIAEVLPPLLTAVRASELKLFHLAADEAMCRDLPGYQRAVALAGPPPTVRRVTSEPVHAELQRRRREESFPGKHNQADCAAAGARVRFPDMVRPLGDEGVALNAHQLLALCLDAGINHLIYAGFNVNWCILMSSGGMLDMSRHGLVCSIFEDATVAVENRATARRQLAKELGLWKVSLNFGMVFRTPDFIAAVARHTPPHGATP